MFFSVVLYAVLKEDDSVHKTERLESNIIRLDNMYPLTDTTQCVLAAGNHGISDFFLEIGVLHPLIFAERFSDPVLIRVSKSIQLADSFILLRFCRHTEG